MFWCLLSQCFSNFNMHAELLGILLKCQGWFWRSGWGLPKDSRIFQYHKTINVIHYINKLKHKNHILISIDTEKALDKIQHPFMIKTLQKMGIEGTYLNRVKPIYDKSTANIFLNGEKLKGIPLRSGTRKGCPLSWLLFDIVLEVLPTAIRAEKEIKGAHIRKEEIKLSLFSDNMILYIENPKDKSQKITRSKQWILQSCRIQNQYTHFYTLTMKN